MLNAYSTLLLVIFLLVLIVLIVSALTVRKRRKTIQLIMKRGNKKAHGWQEREPIQRLITSNIIKG